MNTQKNKSASEKTFTRILALIVIVVLALGTFAVVRELSVKNAVKTIAAESGMSVEEFLASNNITDPSVTGDTNWAEAQKFIPLGTYIGGEEYIEDFKTMYGLDASVTAQTLWGEVADIVMEKQEQLMQEAAEAAANATEAPAEGDAAATEATVEGDASVTDAPAEGDAAATEAPAEGDAAVTEAPAAE